MKPLLLIPLICIVFAGVALGHDPGLSTLVAKAASDRLEVSATFSRKDIEGLFTLQRAAALEPAAHDRRTTGLGAPESATFDAQRTKTRAVASPLPWAAETQSLGENEDPKLGQGEGQTGANLAQLALETVRIEQNGKALNPIAHHIGFAGEDNIELRLTFTSGATGKLTFRSLVVEKFPPGHRQLLSVLDSKGRVLTERLLSANVSAADVTIQQDQSRGAAETSTSGFIALGVEHILTGYDHLLFLLALLIVARSFMASLKVITCFTAAHSLTLALATFDVVQLPSRIVEPLIAASIVYVGIENLVRRGESRWRLALTFGFGLVHGLGFATVLRELGLGSNGNGIALPLISFNLGVELGQIIIAAFVLPLIWKMQQHPLAANRLAPACSLLVTVAGSCWLIQRLLPTPL